MNQEIAKHINALGAFCGKRDLDRLDQVCLYETYGFRQADVMVLFGGSILAGGDVLAEGIRNQIAKKYVIVGGAGHTTETLRQIVHQEYPEILTVGLPEAEVFSRYLRYVHGAKVDLLEINSTNCGNNIVYLLELLQKNEIAFSSIILCQDATMQRRMEAGLRKYAADNITIINYASYQAEVRCSGGELTYGEKIHGMWTVDRYVNLLMGEIPRLSDDADGYGPRGKGYIAHVDIPTEIRYAFEELQKYFGSNIREANPLYASK